MAIRVLPKLLRDLALPAVVIVLGSAVAFGASCHFERERREQILRSAHAIAAESRAAITLKVHGHLAAVKDLAGAWSRFGRPPEPEWAQEAQIVMKNVPGFSYIAWVSLGNARLRVARAPDAPADIAVDEAEARAHADAPGIVGPERSASGGFSYRLYHPVPRAVGNPGMLAAGVDAGALLDTVLWDSAPGYAISVFWGEDRILARARPSRSPELGWWRAEGEVPLAYGEVWRVVHEPTEELAESMLTPFPDYLLVAGLLLSFALGVIVYQLQQARQRGRFLAAANRALDQGMREAREGEASLRRLSEELEGRVRSCTRQLQDTMTELEAFNFSVSHDLRSPLGAVLNFVAILEEEHAPQLSPAGRDLVARIRGSAERAVGLLEGLLKLSRAGRAELEIETLDMSTLAREAFAQARGAGDEGEIELVICPLAAARGDRALVGSVFVNLLGNAVKYTRGREKRRIVVSGVSSGEAMNVYSVADNGVGFDDRHASKLFGAFERLHPSGQYEGAGIGLAIVARIIQRHGGRVWAEGRPEQGATFFFTLPRPDRGSP